MGSKNRSLPDDDYHMSLEAIAKELGVSRQYVWAIEKKALAKIRHKLREWEDYEREHSREGHIHHLRAIGSRIGGID
jgi:predicted DNA-binding protein YlxM (UPF0122 family)